MSSSFFSSSEVKSLSASRESSATDRLRAIEACTDKQKSHEENCCHGSTDSFTRTTRVWKVHPTVVSSLTAFMVCRCCRLPDSGLHLSP